MAVYNSFCNGVCYGLLLVVYDACSDQQSYHLLTFMDVEVSPALTLLINILRRVVHSWSRMRKKAAR